MVQNTRGSWMNFARRHTLEIVCGVLMILGIIFSFFCCSLGFIGGALVGLSVGLFFATPLRTYVMQVRKDFIEDGIFRLMMLLGILLYFLIVATSFVIAAVLGVVLMTLIAKRSE